MFEWIRRLFDAQGGCFVERNPETCIGCQQAKQRIAKGTNGEGTQCHMCKCVWVHKSSAVGWTETVAGQIRRGNTERPNAGAKAPT